MEFGVEERQIDDPLNIKLIGGVSIYLGDKFEKDAYKVHKNAKKNTDLFTKKVNLIEKCILLIKTGLKKRLQIKISPPRLMGEFSFGSAEVDIQCTNTSELL